jgi:hypothetical protein
VSADAGVEQIADTILTVWREIEEALSPLLIIDVGLNTLRPAADERASKPKVANAAKATHAAPRPHARFPPPRTGSGVPRAGRIVRQRTDRAAQA